MPHSQLARNRWTAWLAHSWRTDREHTACRDQVDVAPPEGLATSTSAALAWHGVRGTPLGQTAFGKKLGRIYRYQLMQAINATDRVPQVWRKFEEAGFHPILIKGWTTARLYPEQGLRRLGDMDVCFPPHERRAAVEFKRSRHLEFRLVEVHDGLKDLDRTWEEAYARTRLLPLEGVNIRVLAWEEHLRLTCLHLVSHGASVPQMLCDVAVILEALPDDFDWQECLRGNRVLTGWVLAILGLANRLLGAEIKDPDVLAQAVQFPAWLEQAVPRIWDAGRDKHPISYYVRRPREALPALRNRYLNPMRAAYHIGVLPRNRLQLIVALVRYFLTHRGPQLVLHPLRGKRIHDRYYRMHDRYPQKPQAVPQRSFKEQEIGG